MPWSGNNNQIYKALLELADNGFVTSEVYHQNGFPCKKAYTITQTGLAELKKQSKSMPETFATKKPFLVQLAWTDLLSGEELEELLRQYEQDIKGRIFMEQTKAETGFFKQGRTLRETAVWNLIKENIITSYQCELEWIGQVKTALLSHADTKHRDVTSVTPSVLLKKENIKMTCQLIEKNHQRYIFLSPPGKPIQTETDVIELITVCFENNAGFLLIHGERFSDDFLRLQTGIAGAALQKFATYRIKVAAVIDEKRMGGKFKEFLTESNKGNIFRNFTRIEEAEHWLLNGNKEN
jgi:DNA-binding PadR family transcriptional regulator